MKATFQITTSAYNEIIKKIGSKPAEQGGVLIGKDGIITDFIHDKHAKTSGGTYELNIPYLNPIIKKFVSQDKEFFGILHSHPIGYNTLSPQDRAYFKSQFKNFPDLEKMYTPIVFSAKDGEFHFHPYVFHKDGRIQEVALEIVPDNYQEYLTKKPNVTSTEKIPAKKEAVQPQTEIVKTEKEVVINFHNEVTQKGELDPVVIYVEKEQPENKEKGIEPQEHIKTTAEPEMKILEDCLIRIFAFSKVYHALIVLFFAVVLGLIISLLPTFHKYISQTLLN